MFRHRRPITEVEKFVDKITENEDRCDLYMELKLWRKAFDVAAKLKDANKLTEVRIKLIS